jgi:hypothetical protein
MMPRACSRLRQNSRFPDVETLEFREFRYQETGAAFFELGLEAEAASI